MREHYIPSSNRHGGPKSSVRGNSPAIRSFFCSFLHRFSPFHLSASLPIPFFLSSFYLPLPCPVHSRVPLTNSTKPAAARLMVAGARWRIYRERDDLSRNARENSILHFLEIFVLFYPIFSPLFTLNKYVFLTRYMYILTQEEFILYETKSSKILLRIINP